jgi:hypothetical protein
MDNKTIITLAVTLFVALSGYIAKYVNDLQLARRKDLLERTNQQLRDLYGPLYALVSASNITWQAFKDMYCQDPLFHVEGGIMPQSESTQRIWRHWMRNVFMPLNSEMARVVTEHADLLEEKEMPPCLLKLSAHVHGYKGVLASWDVQDYSQHMSLTNFPKADLTEYAQSRYNELKSRQTTLLKGTKRRALWSPG